MSVESMEQILERKLYPTSRVAMFLGLDGRRVDRWVRGYRYRRGSAEQSVVVHRPSLLHPSRFEDSAVVSFADLIEMRFLRELLKHLPPGKVRQARDAAAKHLGCSHPFNFNRYWKLGKDLFLQEMKEDPSFVSLFSGQYGIPEIIPDFADEVRFDEKTGAAVQWWPLTTSKSVVLDPARYSGTPILSAAGVKTSNILDLYDGENGDLQAVCGWFAISPDEARDAIEWERRLLKAAA